MSVFPSKVNYATGDILTATDMNEIGQAINLLDGAQFAAGKNKIINGDFGIWQRGTSFTDPAGGTYFTDRFRTSYDGTAPTSRTYSQQTFTSGTAPVAGYEGRFFARTAITTKGSNTRAGLTQLIEDVRTFAGQTVTLSFYAKCDTARTGSIQMVQQFGTGGSPSAVVTFNDSSVSFTSSWARYTLTVAVPSISGKTLGTNNDSSVAITLFHTSANGSTFDVWGVQVEAAQTASNFQTATGTLQGELAACQRYYQKSYSQATAPATASTTIGSNLYVTVAATAITNRSTVRLPVTMRTVPTVTIYSTNSGTAAKIFVESTAVDVDGVVQNTGEQSFSYYLNSGTIVLGYVTLIQYTVSAEL
jgi:hypothetical protein